jgi:uncharacterized protein
MNDDAIPLEDFTGVARLFPLPGLTFFPHAVQPLHIFEPRYRQMTADALEGDRLIALCLLKTGWEKDYDHRPGIHPVACLGRIVADQLLPDGRYNLLLRGLHRIRIVEELPMTRLYRQANVEILTDVADVDVDELMALRTALADLILPRFASGGVRDQLAELFRGEMPLGQLCDVLTFAMPIVAEVKQRLLEMQNVCDRARFLMEAFDEAVAKSSAKTQTIAASVGKKFPPEFSPN